MQAYVGNLVQKRAILYYKERRAQLPRRGGERRIVLGEESFGSETNDSLLQEVTRTVGAVECPQFQV